MNKVFVASAVAAAFAVVAPAVTAQSSEVVAEVRETLAAAPAATEASATPRAAPERRAFRSASDRVEARIAYIRTALKITDAQQGQFDNFANVLRKHARDMDQRMQQRRAQGPQQGARPNFRNVSAIERLERTQQRLAQRSARLNEVIGAAKPLYASFSPEQKQAADELLARRGGRGGHPGHRGHGMHRGA